MFHAIRYQSNRVEGEFPDNWNEFGATLPVCHVLNEATFKKIMVSRRLELQQLQQTGYTELTPQEIEQFDQGSAQDFLQGVFTLTEFAFAAGQVMVNNV